MYLSEVYLSEDRQINYFRETAMKKDILKHLLENQGKYVSGEELSSLFGVSRTAIWKHINSIKNDGYPVVSSPRRGYCLTGRPDVLNAQEVKINLAADIIGQLVYFYEKVDSTNEIVKKMAAEGLPEGTVVIAEQQLCGKGRIGRNWVSPAGVGIWFSLLLRPGIKPHVAPQLSLACAAAVCRAIRRFTGLDVRIKWPNDLLIGQKKVCGILTELSAEIDMVNYVIVGIGINVNQKEKDFSCEIKDTATSLSEIAGHDFRRVELLREVLAEIERTYLEYLTSGFPGVLRQWRELCSTLGQEVSVISTGENFSGLAEDIDENGHLLVRMANRELRAVVAGDVSIRRRDGQYT